MRVWTPFGVTFFSGSSVQNDARLADANVILSKQSGTILDCWIKRINDGVTFGADKSQTQRNVRPRPYSSPMYTSPARVTAANQSLNQSINKSFIHSFIQSITTPLCIRKIIRFMLTTTDQFHCRVRWLWQSAVNFRRTGRSSWVSVSDCLHHPVGCWSAVLAAPQRSAGRLMCRCRRYFVLYKRTVHRLLAVQSQLSAETLSPPRSSFLPSARSRKPSTCIQVTIHTAHNGDIFQYNGATNTHRYKFRV